MNTISERKSIVDHIRHKLPRSLLLDLFQDLAGHRAAFKALEDDCFVIIADIQRLQPFAGLEGLEFVLEDTAFDHHV